MIATKDLLGIARARLRDAQVLLKAKRFDGASAMEESAGGNKSRQQKCQTP
jgi:hypothetical protein